MDHNMIKQKKKRIKTKCNNFSYPQIKTVMMFEMKCTTRRNIICFYFGINKNYLHYMAPHLDSFHHTSPQIGLMALIFFP